MTNSHRLGPWRRRIACTLVAATATIVLPVAPSHAQFGEAAGIAESMQREYLSRDLVIISDGLQLDDAQRIILESLFDDYQDSFDDGFAAMRQKFEDMRPQLSGGDEKRIMRMVFSPFEEWIAEKRELGELFRANLRAILNEEQLAAWPAFERKMLREKELHKGSLSGESLNLFHVLRDMDMSPEMRRQLQSTVDEYDLALHDALQRRKTGLQEMQAEMLAAMQEQDAQQSLDLVNVQLDLQIGVRDVNERFIDIIANALPEEEAAIFRDEAKQKAYPRVYRRSAVERMYHAAMDLDELPPELRETMTDLLSTYQIEVESINMQLVQLIKEDEPDKQRHRARAFAARVQGATIAKPEDRTRQAFRRKEEVGSFYVQALRDMLTPEQFAALPGGARWVEKELRQQRANHGSRSASWRPGGRFSSKSRLPSRWQ